MLRLLPGFGRATAALTTQIKALDKEIKKLIENGKTYRIEGIKGGTPMDAIACQTMLAMLGGKEYKFLPAIIVLDIDNIIICLPQSIEPPAYEKNA